VTLCHIKRCGSSLFQVSLGKTHCQIFQRSIRPYYDCEMSSNYDFFQSWNSFEQVARLDEELPGIIQYEGEFGPEIVTFLPFVYNLHIRGLLKNRRISTYSGMKPYYYFLGPRKLIERTENRFFLPPGDRWWPHSDEHQRIPISGETYPSFKRFRKKTNVLFIQNKYCVEWDEGPINFLSLETLRKIFESTEGKFKVVYSRQGIITNEAALGISIDHNKEMHLEDLALCESFPHVIVLEKRRITDFRSYNSRKLYWIDRALLLAGVQGGSNYPWTYFKKDSVILHKRGRETEFSYQQGFYNYLSNPPLALKVVHNDETFIEEIFERLSAHRSVS
jgi:hypothetical protein